MGGVVSSLFARCGCHPGEWFISMNTSCLEGLSGFPCKKNLDRCVLQAWTVVVRSLTKVVSYLTIDKLELCFSWWSVNRSCAGSACVRSLVVWSSDVVQLFEPLVVRFFRLTFTYKLGQLPFVLICVW